MFHPNIDLEGNVCLNILREDWKPVLSINSIIYGLQFLFLVRASPCLHAVCCALRLVMDACWVFEGGSMHEHACRRNQTEGLVAVRISHAGRRQAQGYRVTFHSQVAANQANRLSVLVLVDRHCLVNVHVQTLNQKCVGVAIMTCACVCRTPTRRTR